jgi:phosphoribosylamine--glycine ligase
MRVLIVGGGGREHALAWKIAQSPLVESMFAAPGNPGIASHASCVDIGVDAHDDLVALARRERIDLTVVGPEIPLVGGLADKLTDAGLTVFGPSARAAAIEGSKVFSKSLMSRAGVPTARFASFDQPADARRYCRELGVPLVVKADGLAAGKGAIVCRTLEEADAAIAECMERRAFGLSGARVVVEEFMVGQEVSFFVLANGSDALPLAAAEDHKTVFDGDRGPNTGGMGCYSPVASFDEGVEKQVMETIVRPTLAALTREGAPYRGVLYVGLMLTADGPKVVEYNCRFGDPECQVLMLRLKSDLLPALVAARDGQLKNFDLRWSSDAALTVVMAAKGYPGQYAKGTPIEGLDAAAQVEGVEIFHAGTVADGARILANGGRVLNVCATGRTVREAQARAYQAVDKIKWPDGFCRRDIAWRAVERET